MRKTKTPHVVAIALALLAGTLALPATPAASTNDDTTVTRQVSGPITVQRLLGGRIEWAVKMARALRSLDPGPASRAGGFAIESITDEPDPVGISRDPSPDPLPGEVPEPEERDEESESDGQAQIKELGP